MRALSRKNAYRKSTLRNLATSLILFERIKTTTPKAKELKPVVEHLINSARPGDVNGRRKLMAYLFDENAVKKVIEVLLPRFEKVPTGFINSYKLNPRKGDGAEMTILELRQAEPKTEIKETNTKEEAVKPKTVKKVEKVKNE